MSKNTVKNDGRSKPMTPKAGVTRNPKRKFCGGGKLFKRGGKLCKRK